MPSELKSYPAYKDSGLPWLGEVPEHWDIQRLKNIADNITGMVSSREPSEPYVALEHVEGWTGRVRPQYVDVVFANQVKRFRPGDILFGKLRPYLAKVTRLSCNGVCVGEFLVLRSSKMAPSFLEQMLRSKPLIDVVDSSTFGAKMPRADWTYMGSLLVPVPPLPEQAAIVRYLDYVDSRIRRYIRAKERLIELLTEQKQAIIHQAVTRGLDPDVPLKPSGVEWLGDIPAHWEARRAKYSFREVDERSDTGDEELLSVSHITGVTPRSQKNITMFMAESYAGQKLCRKDDLVINTMWAWMGALGIASQKGIVSSSYAVYRPRSSEYFATAYIDRLLRTQSYISEFICRSTGIRSSRLRLYPEQFLDIPITQPPKDEQKKIVKFIQQVNATLDDSIERAKKEIELIDEYRTRLIADVVTGKLDVREVAARLPDEVDDEEPDANADTEKEKLLDA